MEGLLAQAPDRNEITKILKTGWQKIRDNTYEDAILLFNKGLRLDPTNGILHFLNAFSYHLISRDGNAGMRDLAQSGYQTTLKFDGSNYLAAYLLGNIYFDKKEYVKAQNQFAYGLLYAPNNPYLLRSLATASYYCNDVAMNRWASEKAYRLDPNNLASIENLIFSRAASGQEKSARGLLHQYKTLSATRAASPYIQNLRFDQLRERLDGWNRFYVQHAENLFGLTPRGSEESTDGGEDDDSFSTGFGSPDIAQNSRTQNESSGSGHNGPLPQMALVDVVIIETEEVKSQSKGINLLEGLKATLGGTISYTNQSGSYYSSDSSQWTVNPSLEFSGLTYNFNIFNDGKNKAEVLARPSLLAIEGETSKFYSGSTLHVALNSDSGDGTIEDIHIGINLAITPHFLGDDVVKIQVHADRALLVPLDEEVGFASSSQTSRTSVDATAVLKIDETLILSGLSENAKDNSESGVPLLQEIPGVQYLFSKKVSSETKKSILILMTPRVIKYFKDEIASGSASDKQKDRVYTRQLKAQEHITLTNLDAALAHSNINGLYRQFRSGDLKLDAWNNEDTFAGALKRMLGFLYY